MIYYPLEVKAERIMNFGNMAKKPSPHRHREKQSQERKSSRSLEEKYSQLSFPPISAILFKLFSSRALVGPSPLLAIADSGKWWILVHGSFSGADCSSQPA